MKTLKAYSHQLCQMWPAGRLSETNAQLNILRRQKALFNLGILRVFSSLTLCDVISWPNRVNPSVLILISLYLSPEKFKNAN